MHNSRSVQVMQSRDQLSYEWSRDGLREPLLFEIVPHVRQKLSPLCHLCHQTVEVAGLHGLIETDDVRVPKTTHELSLPQKVFSDVLLLDLICFNDLHSNLLKSRK